VKPRRTFWELRNIGMVNWFLFGAKDIRVHGRIALTGPNGAGKSSILDAMQTVLTGKSGRHLQLNSLVQTGTDRSVRRTVRDYCLGTVDDAEDGTTHVRDQAISYLLLGFTRSDINRSVTVGICLAASKSQPDEEVLARFIADGVLLGVDDVCRRGSDADGEWTEALPWDEVAAKLRADPSIDLRTESGPEIFVKSLCRALGPEDGVIDPHKFLRNLKNAAAFRPVGNTTDFVRGFILDAQTLNLGDLRESIARYKAVQMRIADLKQRRGRGAAHPRHQGARPHAHPGPAPPDAGAGARPSRRGPLGGRPRGARRDGKPAGGRRRVDIRHRGQASGAVG